MATANATGLSIAERLAWAVLVLAIAAVKLNFQMAPLLANDSLQYISVAEQFRLGHWGVTPLVHFDAERSFGSIPAPIVTFPIGYAVALAALSMTGLGLVGAALIVAMTATAVTVLPLAALGTTLGLTRAAMRAVLLAFVANSVVLEMSVYAISDSLFTLILVTAAYVLVVARRSRGRSILMWASAGALFGIAYWVRYAGLFALVGLVSAGAIALLQRAERRIFRGYAVAIAVGAALISAGLVRNIVYVGYWRGGNDKAVYNGLASTALSTLHCVSAIVLGLDSWAKPSALGISFLVVATAATVLFVCARARRPGATPANSNWSADFGDIATICAVYVGLMSYAGLTTVISYNARMFLPVVPLVALTLAAWADRLFAVTSIQRPRVHDGGKVAALSAIALYVVSNLLSFSHLSPPNIVGDAATALDARDEHGRSATTVIHDLVDPDGVIVATHGQATGYYLHVKTVSLVDPAYSRVIWSEVNVCQEMRRFHARALIVSAPSANETYESALPSEFLQELWQGRRPVWLSVELRTPQVFVFVPNANGCP